MLWPLKRCVCCILQHRVSHTLIEKSVLYLCTLHRRHWQHWHFQRRKTNILFTSHLIDVIALCNVKNNKNSVSFICHVGATTEDFFNVDGFFFFHSFVLCVWLFIFCILSCSFCNIKKSLIYFKTLSISNDKV